MNYCVVTVCSLVVISAICGGSNALPSSINVNIGREEPRNRREISDECRPPFHRPHHHHGANDDSASADKTGPPFPPSPPPVCCEFPDFSDFLHPTSEIMGKCHHAVHEMLHGGQRRNHHHSHRGGLSPEQEPLRARDKREAEETENVLTNKEDAHVDRFQEKKECFASCLFNASGYLLADDMLNEEALNQKLLESIANDTKWTTIVDSAFKKCIAAAKEANSQSQKTCKAGPSEYMKCMTRELFFNCPSDIWKNSQECTEIKDRLEKCPNLTPPPPHHAIPPPHHHHHHHHHRHRDHHKVNRVNTDNRNEETD